MVPEAEFTIASRISASEEIKRGRHLTSSGSTYAKSNIYLMGRLCDTTMPVFYLYTHQKNRRPG